MNEYPKSDFPYTFYFQGRTLPKWSNCWMYQAVEDSRVDWYLDQVHGRMDHVGVIESEDAEVFLIAAQQVLIEAIDGAGEFGPTGITDEERAEMYASFLSGLQEMIRLCEGAGVVFWTSGCERDGEMLVEAMRRFELGPSHADYFAPPHRERRRSDRLFELNCQRRELRRRVDGLGRNKVLKRFLHELKDLRRDG